jgi:ribose transport system substrate-binding protein
MTVETPAVRRPVLKDRNFILLALVLPALVVLAILWFSGLLKPDPRVALITAGSNAYWEGIIRGAEDAAKQHDVNLTVIRASGDETAQSEEVRKMLENNTLDGMAVSPNDEVGQAGLLRQVAAKMPLVTFDADAPDSSRLWFVGTDNYFAGRQCAEMIREALPEGGEIILCVGSVEKSNGRFRRLGVIDALLERAYDPALPMEPLDKPLTGGKYTIVKTLVDEINPDKARELAEQALKEHPNVKCMVGLYAGNAPAILEALKNTGKLGQVKVIGFDTHEETLAGIEQGHVYATMRQDAYNCGYDTIRALADTLHGERRVVMPASPMRYLIVQPVTKADVQQVREQLARLKPKA